VFLAEGVWARDKVAAVAATSDLGVATSGRYERGDHIIDPSTGRPSTGLMSMTVIGPDLALADGYATVALVLGVEGARWRSDCDGIAAIVIDDDRRVTLSTTSIVTGARSPGGQAVWVDSGCQRPGDTARLTLR